MSRSGLNPRLNPKSPRFFVGGTNESLYEGSSNTSARSTTSMGSPNDFRNGFNGSPAWSSSSAQSPLRSPVTSSALRKEPPRAPRALRGLGSTPDNELKYNSTQPAITRKDLSFEDNIPGLGSLTPPVTVLLSGARPGRASPAQKVLEDSLLLELILGHLEQTSLFRCLRVSEMWFQAAADTLWRILHSVRPLHHLLSVCHPNVRSQNNRRFTHPVSCSPYISEFVLWLLIHSGPRTTAVWYDFCAIRTE